MIKHLKCEHRATWVRALMCLFIDMTYARIGNSDSAKENGTFGVTTWMTKKHVRIEGNKIIITYTGKHCMPQQHTFRTSHLLNKKRSNRQQLMARRLKELIDENNKYLFTNEQGKPFTPQQVNEYFRAEIKDPLE